MARMKQDRRVLYSKRRRKTRVSRFVCNLVFSIFAIIMMYIGYGFMKMNASINERKEHMKNTDDKIIHTPSNSESIHNEKQELPIHANQNINDSNKKGKRYDEFFEMATSLAALTPEEILEALNTKDPFEMRSFSQKLKEKEVELDRKLTLDEIKHLFPCPVDRISLPDKRDHTKAEIFRKEIKSVIHNEPIANATGSFIFFQHLRKAGGTHFCSVANQNLPREVVPRYYCMADRMWHSSQHPNHSGAGYMTHYTNEEIMTNMKNRGFRIAGNEWDPFRRDFLELPALYITSFRSPMDRAVSQFRFECLEHRGCHIDTIEEYWKRRGELVNVYTWTFSNRRSGRAMLEQRKKVIKERVETMQTAIDTLSQFHLVLFIDWLSYSTAMIQEIMGFEKIDEDELTNVVRPHIHQAPERNEAEKTKYDAKSYLSEEMYASMNHDLALDEILTDIAKRLFLERLVCEI